MRRRLLLAGMLVAASCGQSIPQTRLYRLSMPPIQASRCARGTGPTLMVDELQVDAAYDDPRIVYRTSEYRIDHYEYHEWSAPPGELVGDALRDGLESTGLFQSVQRGWDGDADAILRGRIVALEEIDRSPTEWVGRIELELELVRAEAEDPLWAQRFEVVRPLPERSPAGLAAATSTALAEIVGRSTPKILLALDPSRRACVALSSRGRPS